MLNQIRMARLCILPFALFNLLASHTVCGQWIEKLPESVRSSILWSADYEEGDLSDWTFPRSEHPGGGVLNTGEAEVSTKLTRVSTHSGKYAVMTQITGAVRSQRGKRAVRLMRWTDKPWDRGGACLPLEAFYSTWIYVPMVYNPNKYAPWDPGDGGWWNVFQFKSHDEQDVSQPMWSINIAKNDQTNQMEFYLYSAENEPASYSQEKVQPILPGKWIHLEAYYKVSAEKKGRITVWQDGVQILTADGVRTSLTNNYPHIDWGIGNYTDHITGDSADGTATLLFDDSIISRQRVSEHLSTTR
jgi:hypothetical protein